MKIATKAAVVLLGLVGVLSVAGCRATGKAVNSSKLASAVTEAEKHPGVIQFPASWVDQSATGIIQLTTHAGKDYEVEYYYPDGQLRFRLLSKRSAVLDSLLAGIDAIDLHKQQYEGQQTDKIIDLTKWGISQGIALATARGSVAGVGPLDNGAAAQPPQPTIKQQIAEAVKAEMPGVIAALRDELRGVLPAPK